MLRSARSFRCRQRSVGVNLPFESVHERFSRFRQVLVRRLFRPSGVRSGAGSQRPLFGRQVRHEQHLNAMPAASADVSHFFSETLSP